MPTTMLSLLRELHYVRRLGGPNALQLLNIFSRDRLQLL